jgi:hypothetical protein
MRKIECYGYNKWPVNFEFPTADDLKRMTKKINIKIKDFKYKRDVYTSVTRGPPSSGASYSYSPYFSGFQLILSNGV